MFQFASGGVNIEYFAILLVFRNLGSNRVTPDQCTGLFMGCVTPSK